MDLSYQLYSARTLANIEDVLAQLAAIGYREAEAHGGLFDDVGRLANALDKSGLTMPTMHVPLDILEQRDPQLEEIIRRFAVTQLACPYIAPDDRPLDAQGYVEIGRRVFAAGSQYASHGCEIGWHNHDFEFQPLPDGSLPIERIFEGGGPSLKWQADIAWIARGGADPLHHIARHGDRINSVHVKDIAPAGTNIDEDGWADIGDGILDWAELLGALAGTGARHYILEHDKPKDPIGFARRSYAAMTQISGQ